MLLHGPLKGWLLQDLLRLCIEGRIAFLLKRVLVPRRDEGPERDRAFDIFPIR